MGTGSDGPRTSGVASAAGMPVTTGLILAVVALSPNMPLLAQVTPGPGARVDAPPEATIETAIDTALVFVGDPITLTAVVEHPEEITVSWPDSLNLGPFDVIAVRGLEPEARNGRVRTGLSVTVVAFELGELEMPAVWVVASGPDGAADTLLGDRFVIEVASVGLDEGGGIRDIRGPLSIPAGWWPRLLWWMLPVLLVLVAYALYRRHRGREEVTVRLPAVVRSPEEIALAELDRIGRSHLLGRGMVKQYHIEVSDALRRYVEGRLDIDAMEMTTREVMRELERDGCEREWAARLDEFLTRCDVVKFAKMRPEEGASAATLDLGRQLVMDWVATSGESDEDGSAVPLAVLAQPKAEIR